MMKVKNKELAASKLKANFSSIYSSSDVNSAVVLDNIASVL
jgi:hypothetical protein